MRRATRAAAKAAASSKRPPPRVVPHLTAEITDFSSQLAETDAEIRNREAACTMRRVLNKVSRAVPTFMYSARASPACGCLKVMWI